MNHFFFSNRLDHSPLILFIIVTSLLYIRNNLFLFHDIKFKFEYNSQLFSYFIKFMIIIMKLTNIYESIRRNIGSNNLIFFFKFNYCLLIINPFVDYFLIWTVS